MFNILVNNKTWTWIIRANYFNSTPPFIIIIDDKQYSAVVVMLEFIKSSDDLVNLLLCSCLRCLRCCSLYRWMFPFLIIWKFWQRIITTLLSCLIISRQKLCLLQLHLISAVECWEELTKGKLINSKQWRLSSPNLEVGHRQ